MEDFELMVADLQHAMGLLTRVVNALTNLQTSGTKNEDQLRNYQAFLDSLCNVGLHMHAWTILNRAYDQGGVRSKEDALSMNCLSLWRVKGCGPKTIAQIRIAFELAGYKHNLADGWPHECEAAYRQYLPLAEKRRLIWQRNGVMPHAPV